MPSFVLLNQNKTYIKMDTIKTANRQDMKSFGKVFIKKYK